MIKSANGWERPNGREKIDSVRASKALLRFEAFYNVILRDTWKSVCRCDCEQRIEKIEILEYPFLEIALSIRPSHRHRCSISSTIKDRFGCDKERWKEKEIQRYNGTKVRTIKFSCVRIIRGKLGRGRNGSLFSMLFCFTYRYPSTSSRFVREFRRSWRGCSCIPY